MRTWFSACLVSVVSLLAGCATSYRVNLDSLAKPGADAISYSLRNVSTEKEESLRYREAAAHVRTALSGRGMFEAPKDGMPDIIVDLDFGVTTEVSRESVRVPVWKADLSSIAPPGSINGPTVILDKEGVLSMEVETVETTKHTKYLRLVARENVPSGENGVAADTWRVDVASVGESKDLRKYLPVLVAATIDYVGKDSQGEISIRLKDTDTDVVFVKKGM